MEISVTMPVYNVEPYLEQAIESALAEPETAEIIVVDDGSEDSSLTICRRFAERDPRIRILRHPNGENRGLAASRNLAISESRCEYVAFLDSDDYYLLNRFSHAAGIFAADPKVDGVFEAVGLLFEDEQTRRRFNDPDRSMHTIVNGFEPEGLLRDLIDNKGWFHFDGIVVKRSLMDRTGLFEEHAKTGTVLGMEFKMAAAGRIMPGILDKPVAMRRMYGESITARMRRIADLQDNKRVFREVWDWAKDKDLRPADKSLIFLAACWGDALPYTDLPRPIPQLAKAASLGMNMIRSPRMLASSSLWRLLAQRGAGKLG
ncbi:MAG: glycosyltransferase family A protein [Desulfomonilaceae bacterium]|nr:glycosyltransferase family A protein [Desulfomonilaceae bacterium]